MKKFILSLAALAFAGIAANAQGTWTPTKTIVASTELEEGADGTGVDNLAIEFGNVEWQFKNEDGTSKLEGSDDIVPYLAGQSQNPVDNATDKHAYGNLYDLDGEPTTPKTYWDELPLIGAYVIYKPLIDGSITVYSVIGSGKYTYVVEKDGSKLTKLDFKAGGVDRHYNYEDTKACGVIIDPSVKFYGNVTFNVKAGKEYYYFCTGSKIGVGAATLSTKTVEISTPVEDIVAENASKVVKTIENGQIIIIKNGVKYNVLGQIVK